MKGNGITSETVHLHWLAIVGAVSFIANTHNCFLLITVREVR